MSEIYSCLIKCERITVDFLKSQLLTLDKAEGLRVRQKMENYTGFMENASSKGFLVAKSGPDDKSRPETFVIINCVLNAPLMVICILGNALVLAVIIRTPSIRSPSMIMLCSLAVSDLLVGFIAQPLFIADEVIKENLVLYRVSAMIGFSACGVSLATITLISIDRFLAVQYHMRYATLVRQSRVIFIIVMIWLFTFVCSGFHIWNNFLHHLLSAIYIAICLIISTFCYIRIYLTVRHHRSHIKAQQQAVQYRYAEQNTSMMRLKRSALNTFLFYIFMIACYFPTYVLLTIFGLGYMEWAMEWTIASTVVFMNSSINPILYCWRIRELRVAVVKTIIRVLGAQTDQD